MERHRIKLSQENLADAVVPSNNVLVELLRLEKDATTKGGIYMGYLEDTTWEDESESHPADIASVIGRVVKVPQKLYYNEDDPNNSMTWDTDMELEIGDLLWFNFLESLNTNEIQIDNRILRFIPYTDVYVAKRSRLASTSLEYDVKSGLPLRVDYFNEQVVMLNGFVLLELMPLPKLSELDHISQDKVYTDRGIVRYVGKPNRDYLNKRYYDNTELEVGEVAYLMPGYFPFMLERRDYFASFEDNKLFYCVQSRRILLSHEQTILP